MPRNANYEHINVEVSKDTKYELKIIALNRSETMSALLRHVTEQFINDTRDRDRQSRDSQHHDGIMRRLDSLAGQMRKSRVDTIEELLDYYDKH